MAQQVTTIEQLKEISLNEGGAVECFILLTGGLRSRKIVDWNDDTNTWHIENLIDGSEQELTDTQLMDDGYTDIGKAMCLGALYYDED